MATVLSPTDQPVIITGVSWQTSERLLPDFQDSHAVRMAFTHPSLDKFPIYAAIDPIKSSWGEQLMFPDGPPSWWAYVVGDRR
jgi:hypothetical protein